jgi:diguanylate cyclase (GGDEF)-like protein
MAGNFMRGLLDNWRFYGLKEEEYRECMKQTYIKNLYSLRKVNFAVAVLAFVFTLFPLLVERNFIKSIWEFLSGLIALVLGVYINHKCCQHKQGKTISNRFIKAMIIVYYANVVLFGIYLGVWSNPGKLAVSFMGILICALSLLIIPPRFALTLTLGAIVLFITATVSVKPFRDWSLDTVNALFAGCVSLFFGWQTTMFRMSLALAASRLEDERNSYYHQSTVDELTQLKNRRDFFQNFQRFLTNYRQSDNYLCIAIMDIDFFKNYNDHYGHPMGDECLRAIGRTLKNLQESTGVYAARVGGEEFGLIWFEEKAENVTVITSRVNNMISELGIPHEKSVAAPYVTVSIGVYVAECRASNNMDNLYNLADKALYAAKTGGRNRAVITTSDSNI